MTIDYKSLIGDLKNSDELIVRRKNELGVYEQYAVPLEKFIKFFDYKLNSWSDMLINAKAY